MSICLSVLSHLFSDVNQALWLIELLAFGNPHFYLGFFSLAEQCHTQIYEDNLKIGGKLKIENDLKNKDDLIYQENLKKDDDIENEDNMIKTIKG